MSLKKNPHSTCHIIVSYSFEPLFCLINLPDLSTDFSHLFILEGIEAMKDESA